MHRIGLRDFETKLIYFSFCSSDGNTFGGPNLLVTQQRVAWFGSLKANQREKTMVKILLSGPQLIIAPNYCESLTDHYVSFAVFRIR